MSIILFIVILAILVLVHEFGHFIVAKKSGIRVDEFGIGFPPKLFGFTRGETRWTINMIPFGGFVKIFGENPDQESIRGPDSKRSFINKPKWIQALVLVAGVSFNLIFAWLLISFGFVWGLPTPANYPGAEKLENTSLVITGVMEGSPAFRSGLAAGDSVLSLQAGSSLLSDSASGESVLLSPESFVDFIEKHGNEEVSIKYRRGQDILLAVVRPTEGILPDKKAIGVSIDMIGLLKLPLHKAFWEGARTTINLTGQVAVGLAYFIFDAIRGVGDFSQVTGPVGIAGLVGNASALGLVYLLSFTAFISINLAVINLIPFPALDGGRLLFVLIEKIKGSPIPTKIANTLNAVGFVLLLLLMLAVTYHDIVKLL